MYKSRTLAAEAIRSGKVKLNDSNFKPSHIVRPGETFRCSIGRSLKIIEVISLTDRRGPYEAAKKHYADHSPPPEHIEMQPSVFHNPVARPKGAGRPTKKDRRDIEGLSI